jgi:hypothetical protein
MHQISLWDVTKRAMREATLDFFEPLIGMAAWLRRIVRR